MREILFKAKRVDNGEWVEGYYAKENNTTGILVDTSIVDSVSRLKWIDVDPETVGQFTGLLDKNGKKIFEGDYCKKDWGDGSNDIDNVTFFDGCFWCGGSTLRNLIGARGVEIIGSIHDKKEGV